MDRWISVVRKFLAPVFSVTFAASLGASLGVALAQDLPPGQLNKACAADCAARSYD